MEPPVDILVTNDDGVTAPGLAALAATLRDLGRVSVIAPDRNWSASGHVKTMHKPLRLEPARTVDGIEAMATNGAPSDCVALAVLGALGHGVDLVIAGVNPKANLGHDVTYSGTVTAAMEAAIWGKPGIAVSTVDGERTGYEVATAHARRIVEAVLEHGLPPHTLLNVNVPALPLDEVRGVRVTRLGLVTYHDRLIRRVDPRGRPYYWIGGELPQDPPESGSDYAALAEGYVSVTPLDLDLTADAATAAIEKWALGGS
jgi:5'-nucleotidase